MSSSLKISLKPPRPSTEQPTKAALHKATKRRITSDDEDSDSTVSSKGRTSHPKPPSKKPRLSHADDAHPRLDAYPRSESSQPTAAKSRVITGGTKKVLKKQKRIVSDDEDDAEEFVPEPEDNPVVVAAKPKHRDLKGKVKPDPRGGATGGKMSLQNGSVPPVSSSAIIGKKRARTDEADTKQPDLDVDVTSVPSAPTPPVPAPIPETEPPKKKLPTIKKKSKTDSAASSTFVSPAPAPPPKAAANPGKASSTGTAKQEPSLAAIPKKPSAPVQATTMNPSGSGDFDLRDSNTWASLIGKGTSNSGPRVGIEKRVSTEERRKQLDQMRDDARVRREDQYRHTFDLQAQSQKIAAFERKCASHKTRIPGPNVLGAAFKTRPIRRS
ncbi:hypothetical protein JB92DRAFT_2920879 [Gautieria morchelliformis]|nr:hypothetical protein JB92DRAFT_2920879 [Gautieria morchelliformis]